MHSERDATSADGATAEDNWLTRPRYSPDGFRHPLNFGVERHPKNSHRFLLQFDHGEKLEVDVHQGLILIDMIAGFLRACIGSEHEREMGLKESRRLRAEAQSGDTPKA